MKTITLIKGSNEWMARFDNDQETIDLFGTDTIPTPYKPSAEAETVLQAIKTRNPGYNVVLA